MNTWVATEVQREALPRARALFFSSHPDAARVAALAGSPTQVSCSFPRGECVGPTGEPFGSLSESGSGRSCQRMWSVQ